MPADCASALKDRALFFIEYVQHQPQHRSAILAQNSRWLKGVILKYDQLGQNQSNSNNYAKNIYVKRERDENLIDD